MQHRTEPLKPCPRCGERVRDLGVHWTLAQHYIDPAIRAVSVRFPLDAKATAR